MKYDWRPGNTTYFEDRRFEGTVMFDDRIKPNFVKIEVTLAICFNFHINNSVW